MRARQKMTLAVHTACSEDAILSWGRARLLPHGWLFRTSKSKIMYMADPAVQFEAMKPWSVPQPSARGFV